MLSPQGAWVTEVIHEMEENPFSHNVADFFNKEYLFLQRMEETMFCYEMPSVVLCVPEAASRASLRPLVAPPGSAGGARPRRATRAPNGSCCGNLPPGTRIIILL